jgi:hypothetical protein
MSTTRRSFIKLVGITTASWILARCAPLHGEGGGARDRLRDSWKGLDWLAQQAQDDYERGDRARTKLTEDHRQALDDLVATGELDNSVADELDSAFQAAANHVLYSNAPITCYEPAFVDYTPTSSDQLVRQADLLVEIAERGEVSQQTISRARAAIERDIAFLNLSSQETQALYDALLQGAEDTYHFPPFEEINLEISSASLQAARYLVQVLLE